MIIPSVMFLEMALEVLKKSPDTPIEKPVEPGTIPKWARASQLRELHTLGDTRVQAVGATAITKDFEVGYELGVQVCRVLLLMNVKAVQAGCSDII